MKRALFALATLSSLALITPNAQAHEEDMIGGYHPRTVDPTVDRERYQSKRYGALELRVSPYWIHVDDEFGGATPYADAFGSKPPWAFGVEADWQALRIPHFGSLGPGVAWHIVNRGGVAEFEDGTEGSVHPDRLWMMPMFAVAVLRVDVFKRDFGVPLVPYAKFGFGLNIWEARDARQLSNVNGVKARGLETGWTSHLGLMLHLNPLAPQSSAEMDATTGVNDMYLFGEWWYSDVDSFNKGLQTGSNTVSFGLAFEF